ncbi:MAG: hypothetical protein CME72_11665 [Halomonadaceae bacterium]|nr:hypothetical protein [Halomonadaceae bacterium]
MAFTHNPKPADERFLEKVSVDESGCWLWNGYVDRKGYGVFGVSSKETHKAHRYSYRLHVGEVPEGKQLDHLCRVRHCVNPDHLEPVTNRENTIRGVKARPRATHCRRGHEFTQDNTYYHPKTGRRECRECRLAAFRRNRKRKS